jgi:hypothetical protein
MKHVKTLSRNPIPAPAIFIIEVETKSECADVEPYGDVNDCKARIKEGRVYTYVIP